MNHVPLVSRLRREAPGSPLGPELLLAIACCRWPVGPDEERRIGLAAADVRDWELFEQVVRRNRIGHLVHHALQCAQVELPAATRQRLSKGAVAAATRALVMAREALRLQGDFERAELPVMIVKGIPLAMLAYGQLGMKESIDIDILSAPEQVLEARRLLHELGYRNDIQHLTGPQFETFSSSTKEAEFFHPTTRILVELHWRLVDHPVMLAGVGVHSPSQDVAIPGGSLRTLADDELFAYLCVHGATSSWDRLKWLADLGALLARRSPDEIERLYARAAELGGRRAAALALLLCHRLFDLELGDELLKALRRDRIARALERNVMAILSYREGVFENEAYSETWLRERAAQFFVASGPRHFLAEAGLVWNAPIDRVEFPLPPRLAFLYPLLRVPLWLGRAGRKTWAAWRG